jgi:hypothetical protein
VSALAESLRPFSAYLSVDDLAYQLHSIGEEVEEKHEWEQIAQGFPDTLYG